MIKNDSPFIVVENFLTPRQCTQIIDTQFPIEPNSDKDGNAVLTSFPTSQSVTDLIVSKSAAIQLDQLIFDKYQSEYKGMVTPKYEWIPQEASPVLTCANSEFREGQWHRINNLDFVGIVFLSSHAEQPDFDLGECYGGKLEFPNHGFGFMPQAGTLILFPGDMRFIHTNGTVVAGDLFQLKFHVVAETPFFYDPANFPGNYTTWF